MENIEHVVETKFTNPYIGLATMDRSAAFVDRLMWRLKTLGAPKAGHSSMDVNITHNCVDASMHDIIGYLCLKTWFLRMFLLFIYDFFVSFVAESKSGSIVKSDRDMYHKCCLVSYM